MRFISVCDCGRSVALFELKDDILALCSNELVKWFAHGCNIKLLGSEEMGNCSAFIY